MTRRRRLIQAAGRRCGPTCASCPNPSRSSLRATERGEDAPLCLLRPQSRNDGSRSSAIFFILWTEGGRHEALFDPAFHDEADPKQDHGNQAPKLSTIDGGPEHGQNHPGVDGMAHPAIRPRADELMFHLDGDCAAPIPAKVSSGPDREQQACRGDCDSEVFNPRVGRQNAKSHPTVCDVMTEHRVESSDVNEDIRKAGAEVPSGLCFLGSDRQHQPDHEPYRPEISNHAHSIHLAPRKGYVTARARAPRSHNEPPATLDETTRLGYLYHAMRAIVARSGKPSTQPREPQHETNLCTSSHGSSVFLCSRRAKNRHRLGPAGKLLPIPHLHVGEESASRQGTLERSHYGRR